MEDFEVTIEKQGSLGGYNWSVRQLSTGRLIGAGFTITKRGAEFSAKNKVALHLYKLDPSNTSKFRL